MYSLGHGAFSGKASTLMQTQSQWLAHKFKKRQCQTLSGEELNGTSMKRFYYKIIILASIVTGSCNKNDDISLAGILLLSSANLSAVIDHLHFKAKYITHSAHCYSFLSMPFIIAQKLHKQLHLTLAQLPLHLP
jgi:hypothetical protein